MTHTALRHFLGWRRGGRHFLDRRWRGWQWGWRSALAPASWLDCNLAPGPSPGTAVTVFLAAAFPAVALRFFWRPLATVVFGLVLASPMAFPFCLEPETLPRGDDAALRLHSPPLCLRLLSSRSGAAVSGNWWSTLVAETLPQEDTAALRPHPPPLCLQLLSSRSGAEVPGIGRAFCALLL